MIKKTIKYFDYFFVLRPTLFFPVWTLSLAGLWAQSRFGSHNSIAFRFEYFHLTNFLLLALFTMLMGAVFLINQIEDVESDKLNNKLFLIANGDISIRKAYIETVLLIVVPIIIVIWKRPELAFLMAISFIIMGWMYSCRPIVLKDKPIGGILPNFFGGYLIFIYGWMIKGDAGMEMVYYATPYVLGMIGVYFLTTVPDIEGDKGANKITVAVKYGADKIIMAGLIMDTLAIIAGFLTRDVIILIPTILIFPFFVKSAMTRSSKIVLTTNKFAALFLSLVICFHYPLYLVLLVFLYFFSKWYYRQRFNITYPSLRT